MVAVFGKLKDRIQKARSQLVNGMKRVVGGGHGLAEETFEELEALLIEADVGVETALGIVEDLRKEDISLSEPDALMSALRAKLTAILERGDHTLVLHGTDEPHVTLIAGVNGSGKTTTAGKLAARLKNEGHSVMLGAADTFRAAAVEQLTIWSERAGVPIVKHKEGADPAAVAYDATDSAISKGVEALIVDTAGRLHTKVNLMEELKKVRRVVDKRLPGAPHDVLLVLDATTGQNALQQAKIFTDALSVTGIVLTKLDGTARGGIVVAIQEQLGIPIKLIGVGEGVDDLIPFDAHEFVDALLAE